MVAVEVRLYGSLRRYAPKLKIGEPLELNMRQNLSLQQLYKRLDIPRKEVKIVLVNGRAQNSGYTLQDGDRVAIFPAVAGG